MIPLHWFFYLALLLTHGRDLLLARPTPAPPIADELRAMVLVHQPAPEAGPDAWPLVEDAAAALRAIEDDIAPRGGPDGLFIDYGTLLPGSDWPEDGTQRAAFKQAAQTALHRAGESEIPDLLAAAAATPRAVPPIRDDNGPYADIPSLSGLRHLVRLSRARMYGAAEQADWDALAIAARDAHALARISAQQGTLISRLVALAASQLALEELRLALVEQREIPEPVLRRLLDDLDEQLAMWPPLDATLEIERLTTRASFGSFFTDDGRGNGLPILTFIQVVGSPDSAVFDWAIAQLLWPDDSWPLMNVFNLYAVRLADKRESLAVIDGYFDGLARLAPVDRPARTPDVFDADDYANALPPRHAATRVLISMMTGAHAKWLEIEDAHRLDLLGARAMLALGLYNAQHSRYPDTLTDLVPDFLPDLPPDPVSGHPLIYRRLDPATDPHARPYLLYSRGHDRADDNGNPHKHNWAAITLSPRSGWTEGFDYILNAPRTP